MIVINPMGFLAAEDATLHGEASSTVLRGRPPLMRRLPDGVYRDPILILTWAVFASLFLVVTVPAIPQDVRAWLSERLLSRGLMVLAIAAFLVGVRRVEHAELRRFRLLAGGAIAVWLSSTLVASYAISHTWTALSYLLSEVLNVFFYLLLVFAANLHPEWPAGWRQKAFEERIERGGTLIFLFALVVYLLLIPANLDLGSYVLTDWASFLLYVVLDLVLVARFVHLARRSRTPSWRTIYALLAAAPGLWITLDALEGLMSSGTIPYVPFGTPLDVLWNLPLLPLVVAGRLLDRRTLPVEQPPAKPTQSVTGIFSGASGLLVIYALLFPCLHIALSALHLVSDATRLAREIAVLVVLFALGAMAWVHHRHLVREARRYQIASERAAARLLETERLESAERFARSIAHDFNNFLTAIGSYADLARNRAGDPRVRRYLREIERTSSRAGDLVRQLLTFGRSRPADPTPLALNQVVRRFLPTLQRLVDGTGIELRTELDHGLWTIRNERSHLEQVLLNLLVNARDAMPEGGEITITTENVRHALPATAPNVEEAPQPMVLLTVSDTGEGIPADQLPRIFEPSFTTKKRGTGLGLATIYGIVHGAGGDIEVDSEPGRGTTFRLYLPAAVIAAEPATDIDTTARKTVGR